MDKQQQQQFTDWSPDSNNWPTSQPYSNSDWNSLFSAPLNPTVFAALAANGVIAPPNNNDNWSSPDQSYSRPSPYLRPSISRQNTQRRQTRQPPSDSTRSNYEFAFPHPPPPPSLALPPSLWMSPASTTPSTPSTYSQIDHFPIYPLPGPSRVLHNHTRTSTRSSTSSSSNPVSIDPTKSLFSDFLTDDLFASTPPAAAATAAHPSGFSSPRLRSGSPDITSTPGAPSSASTSPFTPVPSDEHDPAALARADPLATQVWRMYARTRAVLPHAQRMENLTWRMMALALKRKKEREEEAATTATTTTTTADPSALTKQEAGLCRPRA